MAFNEAQCNAFASFLFRRTPDWDQRLAEDRQPWSYLYSSMYNQVQWTPQTGTTHTWDKVHVTRPNDTGCWDAVNIDACATNVCDPPRIYTGWGSTRATYTKFHQDYQTPVFCFDQLRDTEDATRQLDIIIKGHKKMPDSIISDFLRLLSLRQADKVYIAGSDNLTVDVTDGMFQNQCKNIDLGGTGFLPTSKLTMNYLNNHVEDLQYNGYFDSEFMPQGKFLVTSDIQTLQDLGNANPALTQMYNAADFVKGGKFYAYGVMSGVGNWMFKVDPEPMRFQHIGGGVLQRIWPYQNVATTVGKKPEFDVAYKNAPYQLFHVYNRAARDIYVGDTAPVNPQMPFLTRNMLGKWSWKMPDYFKAVDPNTGGVCEFNNDKKNKGYFLGEFELGAKTVYPEIEMMIIALREPACLVNVPRCAANPAMVYQSLLPYNQACTDTTFEQA